jgi:hypothetical protein
MDENSIDDPRAYPRIYRLRRGKLAFYLFTGLLGLFLAITVIGIAKTSPTIPNETVRHNFVLFGMVFAVFGVFVIVDALRYRLILHFDRIELYTFFLRHHTVLRDNLAYIEWLMFKREMARDSTNKKTLIVAGTRPALIRKDKTSSPLFFPDRIKTDQFFDRWLSALRNSGSSGEH